MTLSEQYADIVVRRDQLISELLVKPSGLNWCNQYSELIDSCVCDVYERVQADLGELPPLSIVATGGYGRRELAPRSDIDLSIIPLDERHPKLDAAIRALFGELQNVFFTQLHTRVSYNYRLVMDVPGLDAKTLTSLMESRLIIGSADPLELLQEQLWGHFPVGEYVIAKIRERGADFKRLNSSPRVVEPHLKNGAGGLRCFQTGNWIRMALGSRPARPTPAYNQIIEVRNILHAIAQREQEVLTRPKQAKIAELLQRDMFEWMASVSDALEENHNFYADSLEELHEARYLLTGEIAVIGGEVRLSKDCELSDAALGVAYATELGLKVSRLKTSCIPSVKHNRILTALAGGETVIRSLDRSGILEQLLPELAATRALMPRDSAHEFAVMEHTLQAIRTLDTLRIGSDWLRNVYETLREPGYLTLAILLHDVGKIDPSRPHSELGEEMAFAAMRRLDFDDEASRLVAWLVKEHLVMARYIRMRDIGLPETIEDFAKIVQSEERLRILTILTYCDIGAVSNESWSPTLDSYLRELFERTLAHLKDSESSSADPGKFIKRALKQSTGSKPEAFSAFLESLPAHYLVSMPVEAADEHFAMYERAKKGIPTVSIQAQRASMTTELTVCVKDAPGLLSMVLAAIYAHDLNIEFLRAHTTTDGIAIDSFAITYGQKAVPESAMNQLDASLTRLLEGTQKVDDLLRQHNRDPDRKQESAKYKYIDGMPGILEVQAPKGKGMAFRISRFIAEQGWDICGARVGQWAGDASAAFYITLPDRKPLSAERVHAVLTGLVN